MEQGRVERLAHLGWIAAVINDFGRRHMMDRPRVPEAHAVMTPGEAVAGMMRKGLGVAPRPFS
jgi:hypothetical protein